MSQTGAERTKRYRRAQKLRGLVPPEIARGPAADEAAALVDAALGSPEEWHGKALEIAQVTLKFHEHLRDGKWGDQLMSYCHHEARLRLMRGLRAAMDPVKARTEILLYEETTEGLPSSGLTKRYSEAQKVLAMDVMVDADERLAITMRRELGITPASWARMRAEMERKKDFDFALFVVEDEASAG